MADMRRRRPEPPPGPPTIQHTPGMADEMLQELGPLLAEDGIDVNNLDVSDMDTLQKALNRAIERRNTAMFTPVGQTRELAVTALRRVVDAIVDDDGILAAAVLDEVKPESPDNLVPTVSACIGVALGLLDDWLSGHHQQSPAGLGQRTRLPAGHWAGERAATDILVLARKGRAVRSLDTLLIKQGGHNVLYGACLALAAAMQTWAQATLTAAPDLTRTEIR